MCKFENKQCSPFAGIGMERANKLKLLSFCFSKNAPTDFHDAYVSE